MVDGIGRAEFDFAKNGNYRLEVGLFDEPKEAPRRVDDDLCQSIVIAKVDEENATMIAQAEHPARNFNGLARVRGAKLVASMSTIRMHKIYLPNCRVLYHKFDILSITMHRFQVATELLNEECPTLPREAMKHLKVVRVKDGEELELFDGKGAYRRYELKGGSLTSKGERLEEAKVGKELTLFACITKGSRWDWTIEKATELGVRRIVPVISERTIVRVDERERESKRERYLRIVEDASRQSHSYWVPEVVKPMDFKAAVELAKSTTCFVGAITTPPPMPLLEALSEAKGEKLSVFIGPEGDFTSEELDALLRIGIPVSLGPTILRAETAALYAISVIMSGAMR